MKKFLKALIFDLNWVMIGILIFSLASWFGFFKLMAFIANL